jgi:hypothetical protein
VARGMRKEQPEGASREPEDQRIGSKKERRPCWRGAEQEHFVASRRVWIWETRRPRGAGPALPGRAQRVREAQNWIRRQRQER